MGMLPGWKGYLTGPALEATYVHASISQALLNPFRCQAQL
jgi:hypothetical protein